MHAFPLPNVIIVDFDRLDNDSAITGIANDNMNLSKIKVWKSKICRVMQENQMWGKHKLRDLYLVQIELKNPM